MGLKWDYFTTTSKTIPGTTVGLTWYYSGTTLGLLCDYVRTDVGPLRDYVGDDFGIACGVSWN